MYCSSRFNKNTLMKIMDKFNDFVTESFEMFLDTKY